MTGRTHALIGLCTLWLLAPVPGALTGDTIGPLAALAAFGALLPDLDAEASTVRSITVGGIRPFVPFSRIAGAAWGHRGFLHSPLALLMLGGVVALASGFLDWRPLLALWLGYASHLLADACTRAGIPAWPSRADRRFWLLPPGLRFVTGSPAEERLLLPLALVATALLLSRFPGA